MHRSWPMELRGGVTALALVVALLAGTGLIRHDDPIVVILSNLRAHAAVALLLIALILIVLRARLRGLVFLAFGVTVLTMLVTGLAPFSQQPSGGKPDLKLISFNILGDNYANAARIASYLAESDADIVFIQESGPLIPHFEKLAAQYPYQAGCKERGARCGDVLLLSKLPLRNVWISPIGPGSIHQSIRADIDAGGSEVHLFGIQFVRPDYGVIQTNEFRHLGEALKQIDGPLILAGDFNATPWLRSFTGMLEMGGMRRAGIEPGTWPVALGDVGAPIDHILVKGPARLTTLNALPDAFGSNHRGLMAGIAIGDAP